MQAQNLTERVKGNFLQQYLKPASHPAISAGNGKGLQYY